MRQVSRFAMAIGAAASLAATPAEARDEKAWDDASNVAEISLLAAAFAIPAAKRDWTGDLQVAGSTGSAFAIAYGLKQTFPEDRPDGSGDDSFPSGHTSVSFAAAASLQNRYGWEVGLPAHLVAGFVGLSRVEARKHHWYDVMAGAAIGETSGLLITSRQNSRVHVLPWGDAHGGGAMVDVRF